MTGPFALRCRACGLTQDATPASVQYCEACFGPLELARPASPVTPAEVAGGPPTLWRYGPLLPYASGPAAGWTPLLRAERLGAAIGLSDLWLKDETRNPSGSFKDRLVALAVARAHAVGAEVLACASTGNLARAVLLAARAEGMDAVVLVPAGVPVRGAIQVDGAYDALNRLATEAAMRWDGWAWVNVGLRPWYVEGAATLAYETAEQLGWVLPDHVLAPIASGASLLRLHRGFADVVAAGLAAPGAAGVRLSAAQPAGCAPVAAAFAAGSDDVAPVRNPVTIASSLAMGDPPDGPDLLAAVRGGGGAVVAVPEDEILGAVEHLAVTEGVLTEPAGGVVVAALARLAAAGVVAADERVVAYLTGGPAAGMAPGSLGVRIPPTLAALAAALPDHLKDR